MKKIGIAGILSWVGGVVFIIGAIIGIIERNTTPFYWALGISATLYGIAGYCMYRWYKKPFG